MNQDVAENVKKPVDKGCVFLIVTALVLFIVLLLSRGAQPSKPRQPSPPSPPSESQIHTEVAVLCQYAVENQLRAPATADFPFALSTNVVKLDSGTYRLTSYVDAQNGFGAQIRTDFTCEATGSPGSMRATAILLPR